jgi:hypothetical protein
MRRRFRFDRDLDAIVEVHDHNSFIAGQVHVIGDDVGAGVNGLRHMPSGKHFDSKSEHRRENRARGLVEVGNETNFASKRERPGIDYYERKVVDAQQQIAGNWNGTADRLRRERERR